MMQYGLAIIGFDMQNELMKDVDLSIRLTGSWKDYWKKNPSEQMMKEKIYRTQLRYDALTANPPSLRDSEKDMIRAYAQNKKLSVPQMLLCSQMLERAPDSLSRALGRRIAAWSKEELFSVFESLDL